MTPNGDERIAVSVGQRIEFDKGSSTIAVAPIRAPGVITVESHPLDKVTWRAMSSV